MYEINKLLNQIGDFHYFDNDRLISAVGVIKKTGNEVVLECRTKRSDLPELDGTHRVQAWGTVCGTKVTLLDCTVSISSIFHNSEDYFIAFTPSDIIVGRAGSEEQRVSKISASINSLNYMFSSPAIDIEYGFSKDNPALLNFTFPSKITATDEDGEISIYQGFRSENSFEKTAFNLLPYIEYTFNAPVSLAEAIGKIASARNLCSFFADYYLPLENIAFADENSKRFEDEPLCDCKLCRNYEDNIEAPRERFLVQTGAFDDSFQNVWTGWTSFYNSNKYIPTLFYEIICNRSTGLNRFLNLVQAIEIFSRLYRESQAVEICKKYEPNRSNALLKHRLEDILRYCSEYLPIETDIYQFLAKRISDIRNFLTHYGEDKIPPSFQEICSANRLLRFILLAIVYQTVGINDTVIKQCTTKSISYSSLKRDIDIFSADKSSADKQSYFD